MNTEVNGQKGQACWWKRLFQGTCWCLCCTLTLVGCAHQETLKGKVVVITGASSGYSRLVDVNLKGVIYGSYAALRQFRSQEGPGTLVNIGSIDSEVPLAYQTAYSATKAGVLSLGRGINEELRLNGLRKRIKVATVMPWATDTPFWRHSANYSGRTPRMGLMDGPEKAVNAIVRASLHPKEEIVVGWKGKTSYISHHIFPDLTERLSGNEAQKWQINTAPPAPPTSGSLYKPMEGGTGVDDGVRQRIEEEQRNRKQNAK